MRLIDDDTRELLPFLEVDPDEFVSASRWFLSAPRDAPVETAPPAAGPESEDLLDRPWSAPAQPMVHGVRTEPSGGADGSPSAGPSMATQAAKPALVKTAGPAPSALAAHAHRADPAWHHKGIWKGEAEHGTEHANKDLAFADDEADDEASAIDVADVRVRIEQVAEPDQLARLDVEGVEAQVDIGAVAQMAVAVAQDAEVDLRLAGSQAVSEQPLPSIAVRADVDQSADVDQDAHAEIRGYAGPIVTRLQVDQDIDLDQDTDVDIDLDGEGGLSIDIDQWLLVDQDTEIDIELNEEEGVLYVDVLIHHHAAITQDTNVAVDDDFGGTMEIEISQGVKIHQKSDVEVEIEDTLEEHYAIRIGVDIRQAIDADQSADVAFAAGSQGGIEVIAAQTVDLDQDVTLWIDFALL